jgi:predicted HicB family RNase H-like nuclease
MEEKKKRSTPKRLILNIPEEIHEEIRQRANFRYMSITKYVLRALIEKIAVEQQFDKEPKP